MTRARGAALAAAAAAAVPAGAAAALLGAGANPAVAPAAGPAIGRLAVGPGFLAVVPNVLGMSVGRAQAVVTHTRLEFRATGLQGHGPTGSNLRVAAMRPAPGSRVGIGSPVLVTLTERPRGEVVPGVTPKP